ncbi:MAG: ATP phosphoribosyltransferase regulatory subunit, partial [bacterium]
RIRSHPGVTDSALSALDHVESVYEALVDAGFGDWISLDMGVVRDLDYYTGIVFEMLVPKLGKPIAGGGRYDNLYGIYGDSIPATGFALEIDRLLPLVGEDDQPAEKVTTWCPELSPEARQSLSELREQYRVDVRYEAPGEDEGILVESDGSTREL